MSIKNYSHMQSKEHLRREALEELVRESKILKESANSSVKTVLLNKINTILSKTMPNGTLLFQLGPKKWREIRNVGPDEFRTQNREDREDKSKAKFEDVLRDLGIYPELQATIQMLRMSKSEVSPHPCFSWNFAVRV
jgi:hypothetical protein